MDILDMGRKALGRAVPSGLKRKIKRAVAVEQKAEVANLYHCTTHKAASTWMVGLLSDRTTFKYSGLDNFTYQHEWMEGRDPRPYDERFFSEPFPKYTIATRMYLDYSCFQDLPKPNDYRAFFVLRDPRDIVVSWYFSMKNTHPMQGIEERKRIRERLRKLQKSEGLCFAIEYLADYGLFQAQRSWVDVVDPSIRLFKYEDLTGAHQFLEMRALFNHCKIPIPDYKLREVLQRHGFETSEGRRRGEEDRSSHRRKGVAGDWRNHFDASVKKTFESTASGLVDTLGYPPTFE